MRTQIVIIALFFCVSVFPQYKFSIGPEFGVARTNILLDNSSIAHNNSDNIILGINFKYSINENIGLGTGVFYEKKGANDKFYIINDTLNYGLTTISYIPVYLTVPLTVRYTTSGKHKIYADLGFNTGYLLSYNQYSILPPEKPLKIDDLKDNANIIDFGIIAGIGYISKLPFSERLDLSVEIKDVYGLRSIDKEVGENIQRPTNHSISVRISVLYNLL